MKLTSILALASSTCLSAGLLSGLCTGSAYAFTPHEIRDAKGNTVFELRLFYPNDGTYDGEKPSSWVFDPATLDRISSSAQYWADIIKIIPGMNPAIINIGTEEAENAFAYSPIAIEENGAGTLVAAALNNGVMDPDQLLDGAHGMISIGKMDWDWQQPFVPSQLIQTAQVDMTSTLIHEIAHALGISASVDAEQDNGLVQAKFESVLNSWSSHLIDSNGKAAAANQIITCTYCEPAAAGADTFDVSTGLAYFSGSHVSAVLNGAMPGIPLRIDSSLSPGSLDQPFSHTELRNSMMSHQQYSNYMTLMEAEFAALQDIGYTIDRRNLFGYSVYNDGATLINDNPFFGRNSQGTAYIANTYNTATMGLGLHVYGSDNTIIQRADLLSAGAGGAGIRVDGIGNDMTILSGTRVYANGLNGLGVLFAYGRDHSLTQRGDVEALGENGIAVSFDFGHNSLGDKNEYRGSYFVTSEERDLEDDYPDYYAAALAEVNGPLVSSFDLSGRVAGRKAAIYMADSAYVGEINVMQGASITGDIISHYQETDENNDLRLTELRFGLEADDQGKATGAADADFNISYADNITGDNLSLQFLGGTSTLTGDHDLYDVLVEQNATLAGSGLYRINDDRYFHNQGTLNPTLLGGAITIDGDYEQAGNGRLQLAFNNEKQISSLIVTGSADLDATIAFAPERGFYGNGFTLTSDQWLQASTVNGAFTDVTTTLASPTLTASATDNGNASYTVSLSRDAQAYEQYAGNGNARNVGNALDHLVSNPSPQLEQLIAALDFSAPDGSTIRSALPQLSGEAYASASGVLLNASGATRLSVNNRLSQAFGGTPVNPVSVQAFAPERKTTQAAGAIDKVSPVANGSEDLSRTAAWGTAFGSWASQSGDDSAARTKSTLGGFISGIDGSIYDNWRLGVMAGYSRSTFKTASLQSSGSSDNYTLGAYTGTEWDAAQGSVGFRSGLSYSWHTIEMSRRVAFNAYSDSLSADYNAGTFQAFGELGYKHNLSQRSVIEPYANLAYVHVRTDGFAEKGHNGAALIVQSGTMDTTLPMLGIRTSTSFEIGNTVATARADLGWRYAFGDVIPTSTASFAAGSNAFVSAGNAIGKNTALIETSLDFAITKNTKLGVAYQGQFGSGLTQNGVNANFSMKF
ncbi:autotransporter domain-containing protein [Pseudochrobactrum sp. sp1633]|uniref:autotransporter family protein n=1 Tax=Pseudochrobactrum sp. sp1633 TaxID=3036706 RepID=UPI0025A5DB38|nr:autotransporter domain-containing protein [Pseudochrobactrum sp. sp1633]MDM8346602.1 autotransporter domain-containing protein [Pseudochrobactrum sp. sp1633]